MSAAAGCLLGLLLMIGILIFLLGIWALMAVVWSEFHSGAPFHIRGPAEIKIWLIFLSIPVCGAALIWIAVKLLLRFAR